jgi:hypothetical protein
MQPPPFVLNLEFLLLYGYSRTGTFLKIQKEIMAILKEIKRKVGKSAAKGALPVQSESVTR